MGFMFENLDVYQKAVDFADNIVELTEHFPRGYSFLVDQRNRAALSIAANLAEGNGRFTKPDRRNFFSYLREARPKSACHSWRLHDVAVSFKKPRPLS